jgi:hypothetical protein
MIESFEGNYDLKPMTRLCILLHVRIRHCILTTLFLLRVFIVFLFIFKSAQIMLAFVSLRYFIIKPSETRI